MQRLSSDRGAVAVMTALLLVPLLVCAGFVIDIGASYVQRRQLQNAADAAALAIAQYCGNGNCSPDHNQTTADFFTSANAGRAATAKVDPVRDNNTVTVTTKAIVNYEFAPVIGTSNNTVTASATASWGPVTGGTAVIPLTFLYCSFMAQTSGGSSNSSTVVDTERSDAPTTCQNLNPPGGFGWLKPDTGKCTATTSLDDHSLQSTGRPPPHECKQVRDYFSKYLDQIVLLPLYDVVGGNGNGDVNGGWYHIYAYAAFRLTGYDFGGQFKEPSSGLSCRGNCVQGYFLKIVDRDTAFTYGGRPPYLGTQVVALTIPPL